FVDPADTSKGESVVGVHKFYACVGTTSASAIEIAAAGQAERQTSHQPAIPLPKTSHGVAIFGVPFGPEDGKIPNLIAAFAQVPGFRDELHLRQHGILVNNVKERPQPIHRMQLSS